LSHAGKECASASRGYDDRSGVSGALTVPSPVTAIADVVRHRLSVPSFFHEKDWFPVVRPLVALIPVADALGIRRAAAIDRALRRRRGARRGRSLFPRASLCPPAWLAVPPARGGGSQDEPHRDRHGRH